MGCSNTKQVETKGKDTKDAPAGKQEAAVRPLTPDGAENGGGTEPQKDAVTGEEVQKAMENNDAQAETLVADMADGEKAD